MILTRALPALIVVISIGRLLASVVAKIWLGENIRNLTSACTGRYAGYGSGYMIFIAARASNAPAVRRTTMTNILEYQFRCPKCGKLKIMTSRRKLKLRCCSTDCIVEVVPRRAVGTLRPSNPPLNRTAGEAGTEPDTTQSPAAGQRERWPA